ncbi:hypothetical protein [Streptosporangium sp. NPDC002524]|uniref:hypothetical protein n=1 Tax=Streptosporangium sp. NPDC002524 TaxID=3154537 RepID=UPI00331837F5
MNPATQHLKDTLIALGVPRCTIVTRTDLGLTSASIQDFAHRRLVADRAAELAEPGRYGVYITRYPCGCVPAVRINNDPGHAGQVTTISAEPIGHICPAAAIPATAHDVMDAIVRGAQDFFAYERQRHEAWLASPEQVEKRAAIKARRSEAAKRGWDTRRAALQQEKEEQLREEELDELENAASRDGQACPAWDLPGPPYRGEVPCTLYAGHEEPHENVRYGLTWDWENA